MFQLEINFYFDFFFWLGICIAVELIPIVVIYKQSGADKAESVKDSKESVKDSKESVKDDAVKAPNKVEDEDSSKKSSISVILKLLGSLIKKIKRLLGSKAPNSSLWEPLISFLDFLLQAISVALQTALVVMVLLLIKVFGVPMKSLLTLLIYITLASFFFF